MPPVPRREPPPAPADRVNALQRSAGNAAVVRMLARFEDPRRFTYPWMGEIHGTWAAALRESPEKQAEDPHRNTDADLPRGTRVRAVNRKGGWLRVEAEVGGAAMTGYVSQELVKYVSESSIKLEPIEVNVDVPTVAEAFVELKHAETKKAVGIEFSEEEVSRLEWCATVLEHTNKYVVDRSTWRVDFVHQEGRKTQVLTIEDFILFVENVERAHATAKPAEIVSEVRQLWFSDPNWALLVASQGIKSGDGDLVDIETAGPIAGQFDMRQIAPNTKENPEGGLTLKTAMGDVDVSHVIAGLDAAISGAPEQYPEEFLEAIERATGSDKYDTFENAAGHAALQRASGGDVRDFTTWSGDLGQAYSEFLFTHYRKQGTKSLADCVAEKAPRDQLLGDIHGYIIQDVSSQLSGGSAPGGRPVSSVLRHMYLVTKPAAKSFAEHFAAVSGKPIAELEQFITERTLAFARIWFAKASFKDSYAIGFGLEATIEKHAQRFDEDHATNEATGRPEDKLQVLVNSLLSELGGAVK
jgi:hypothetical protein